MPGALLISAVIPWLITPLLMCGGAFLCYEGFEKLVHGLRAIELWIGNAAEHTLELPRVGSVLGGLTPTLMSTAFGVLAGGLIFAVLTLSKRFLRQGSTQQ